MTQDSICGGNLNSENGYLITYRSTPLFASFPEEKNSEDLSEIPVNLIKRSRIVVSKCSWKAVH